MHADEHRSKNFRGELDNFFDFRSAFICEDLRLVLPLGVNSNLHPLQDLNIFFSEFEVCTF